MVVSDNSFETETLARLYLEQGHPEKAARIFRQLLEQDPMRTAAIEGLDRCREAMDRMGRKSILNQEKKLHVLQELLARLTNPRSAKPAALAKDASKPAPVKLALADLVPPGPGPAAVAQDPKQKKLHLLQSLLKRLKAYQV